jgi:NADPH-dependent ferric siderophore reductase
VNDRPEVRRVRHETRRRRLTVREVQHLTPKMIQVTLEGDDLAGFVSMGFDDHVKVFFPAPGSDELVLPTMGPDGPIFAEGAPRPALRDYTPRRYDAAAGVLHLDFAIHDAGPATTWAVQAKPGLPLGVGGPRGSFIIPTEFDWHLLIGDETALPAIGRRLEELPRDTRALVVAEVDGPEEEQKLSSAAPFEVIWVHRNRVSAGSGGVSGNAADVGSLAVARSVPGAGDPTLLLERLRSVQFPTGDYFAWIAAETQVARALRQYLVTERSTNKHWVKAAGYWRRGAAATHDKIED